MKVLRGLTPLVATVVLAMLVGAAVVVFWPHAKTRTLVADFPTSVSLYEGSDVKVLGIPIGKVTKVRPSGTKVVVTMKYDAKYKVPADAKAAIISPSIVGDRFVQLTPVYTRGAVLADGATLGLDRTATPLELDQIFGSLNDLDKALGPQGANSNGSLSRLLDATARNFGGQGAQTNQTIHNVARLTQTLADNKDQLFGTAKDVESFVNALAKNDDTVRHFNDALASGSSMLAGERKDLAAALHNLSVALTQVRGFVSENKQALHTNIKGLNQLASTLVKRRKELDETLRVAPTALNNLALTYNGRAGTLDTRAALTEATNQLSSNPKAVLSTLLCQLPNSKACNALLSLLPRPAALTKGASKPTPFVVEPIDRTLGGLVGKR